jgi:hypothetical protein
MMKSLTLIICCQSFTVESSYTMLRKLENWPGKGGETLTYEVGQIVLLAIPPKNRLLVEVTRLPCRILTVVKGAYTLLS